MKLITPTDEYLEKAKLLTTEDAERLQARMRGKFSRRLEDRKISSIESIALQLQYEDEGLAEWRKRMAEIRSKNQD